MNEHYQNGFAVHFARFIKGSDWGLLSTLSCGSWVVADRWPALLKGGIFSGGEAAMELPLSANRPDIHEDLEKMEICFRTADR